MRKTRYESIARKRLRQQNYPGQKVDNKSDGRGHQKETSFERTYEV